MKLNRRKLRALIESILKENDIDGIVDYSDPNLRKTVVLLKDDGTLTIKLENMNGKPITLSSKAPFSANDKESIKLDTRQIRNRQYQVVISEDIISISGDPQQEIAFSVDEGIRMF